MLSDRRKQNTKQKNHFLTKREARTIVSSSFFCFSDTPSSFTFFQRDIWRRGGLDSISEDEEEEDEGTETNALDGVFNHVNHANKSNHIYGSSTRFNRRPGHKLNLYRKPNHFKAAESWSGLTRNNATEWRNRTNDVEKQPLCVLPQEEDTSVQQSPRSFIRQLAVEVNAGSNNDALDSSPKEKSSPSEPFSDPSLEWDQESFALKNDTNSFHDEPDGESFEMKNMNVGTGVSVMDDIAEETAHDERDKLLTNEESSGDESTDNSSRASDSPKLTKRCSSDFSKHLYLGCDENDVDSPVSYANGDLGAIPETENIDYAAAGTETEDAPRSLYDNARGTARDLHDDVDDTLKSLYNGDTLGSLYGDDVGDTLTGLYDDDVESIGYTDFDTMVKGTRTPRFVSSPTHSSLNKSPIQSIPTSPIESTQGSCRSGFSELPFRGSFTDSFKLSGPSPAYESPKGIPPSSNSRNPRDYRQNSSESSRNSGRLLSLEKPDSPRNKFGSIFSDTRASSPFSGSLKEGRLSREGRARKGGLRRTLTEFSSPTNSWSSLNEKPVASSRRRKVSGAIQPPTIFAPLVANVNNPYKDFVPPVRESPVTCDCEPEDQIPCEGLGLISNDGSECDICYERGSHSFKSDNSEDNKEDFYKNANDFITNKQLRSLSGRSSAEQFAKNDVFSSRTTLTSETSFDKWEPRSDPSQKIDDSSFECNSVKELVDCFERPRSSYSNLHQRPSLSGAYSTQCIEQEEIPESDELFRPMRSSFSEPHLSVRIPALDGIAEHRLSEEDVENASLASRDTTTRDLEDIFKDVSSTKEAIEKLGLILSSPEPDIYTDLADTKETVQKLDKQVLNLNKEVASLSTDVKTVLELLKSLKNGQVAV